MNVREATELIDKLRALGEVASRLIDGPPPRTKRHTKRRTKKKRKPVVITGKVVG